MKAKFSTVPKPQLSLPKSVRQMKASLAPKAAPGPNLTQKVLSAGLNDRQLATLHAVKGNTNPHQILATMQQGPKTGVGLSIAAAKRAQASQLHKIG